MSLAMYDSNIIIDILHDKASLPMMRFVSAG